MNDLGFHAKESACNHDIFFKHQPMGFPGGTYGKEYACKAGDLGSILGLGKPPGEGNSYSLQ